MCIPTIPSGKARGQTGKRWLELNCIRHCRWSNTPHCPHLSSMRETLKQTNVLKTSGNAVQFQFLLKCYLRSDWFWAPGLLDNRNVHQILLFLQLHQVLQRLLALRCFMDRFQTHFGLRLNLILCVSARPHVLHFPSCFTFPSFAILANILVFSNVSSLWLSFRVQNWRSFAIL